jgi:hypothetical protein
MIELPDLRQDFLWENNFYLSCGTERVGKFIAQYEAYRMTTDVSGEIVECGVFKGASLARFAAFRRLLTGPHRKRIVAFDTFGRFPEASFCSDRVKRERFVQVAGDQSIAESQMLQVLEHKGCEQDVDLVAGDICETVPRYVREHRGMRISLLNLDVDLYEPSCVVLEHLFPKMETGGVLLLDDYGFFPGETKAVDEFFRDKGVEIRSFPFCAKPRYIVKQ